MVSGLKDKSVHIWNVTTGEIECVLKGHSDWVMSIAFSPYGKHVVSGFYVNWAYIWNASIGETQQKLNRDSNGVTSVAFLPDGTCCLWLF